MTFEEKPMEDRAGSLAAMIDASPVEVTGKPETVPLTVEQQLPPKPSPSPNKQVACERVYDAKGELVGLDISALPGNAFVKIELRDLLRGRWRVQINTAPRRGRPARASKRKSS
jgi:hypothetical protein